MYVHNNLKRNVFILYYSKVKKKTFLEPLVSMMFKRKDGWPFPEYLGSCGRYFLRILYYTD